jgi:hypothetical protein
MENVVDNVCKVHTGKYYHGVWECCRSNNPASLGCIKQCHDISSHYAASNRIGFRYVVKNSNSYLLQVPLGLWLKIIRKKYPLLKKIPLEMIENSIHNVMFYG